MLIKIIGLTVTLFICCLIGKGQQQYNLVPNYSFEQYNFCPLENNLYYIFNTKPDYWYKPDLRGATYFNSCANVNVGSNGLPEMGMPVNLVGSGYNYQNAKTGNGYVIMFYYNGMDARNYIAVKLKDSLKQGKCYYAEYYVNSPSTFRFGCNNQSMLFTNTPVYVDTTAVPAVYMLPANPQIQNPFIVTDTLNWVKIAGVFTAQGGEQYLTLGNFKNNAQTATQQIQTTSYNGAAYYIEDVTVVPLDSFTLRADAGLDKTITIGDSAFIGSFTTGLTNVTWYNSSGNIIANNVSGLFVKPTASTFYVIEQTVCGQYSRDTVNVTVNTAVPLVIKNYELIIKNEAVVNNWQTLQEVNVSHFNIQFSTNSKDFVTVGTIAAQNKAFNEYQYKHNPTPNPQHQTWFYRIEAVDKDGTITYSKVLPFTLKLTPFTLNIYPNPANAIVNIAFKEMLQVTITDIAGRILFSKQMKGLSNTQLNISTIGKGIFFVQVIGKDGSSETKKLIVK
jgi:hypothetical protein